MAEKNDFEMWDLRFLIVQIKMIEEIFWVTTIFENSDTNLQHQKSYLWLHFSLSETGEGHRITTEDEGSSYDLRAKVKGWPLVALASSRGGAEWASNSRGGEGKGSLGSIGMGRRRKSIERAYENENFKWE